YQAPPPRYPPPSGYARPRPSGMPLGVLALILSLVCGPVGLILGIVALTRSPRPGSADQICAIIAIGLSGVLSCCSLLGYSTLLGGSGGQS
ncbi:hypothetical protein GSF22_32225, partial [Micromonospora echinofusca]|nr:hypothetical protein [Micromonospora echinofusca]